MVDWDLGILQKWPHTNLVVNLQSILWLYTHSNPWNVRGHVVGAACVDTVRPTRFWASYQESLMRAFFSETWWTGNVWIFFCAVLKLNSVFVGTLLLCSFSSPRYSSPLYSSPLFIFVIILYYSDLFSTLLYTLLCIFNIRNSAISYHLASFDDVYVTTHVYRYIYIIYDILWLYIRTYLTYLQRMRDPQQEIEDHHPLIHRIDTLLGSLKPPNAPHDTSKVEGVER